MIWEGIPHNSTLDPLGVVQGLHPAPTPIPLSPKSVALRPVKAESSNPHDLPRFAGSGFRV